MNANRRCRANIAGPARMTQDVDGAERGQEKLPAAWRGRNFKYLDGKSKIPSGVGQGSNIVGKRYRHAYPFKLGKQFLGLRQTPGLAFQAFASPFQTTGRRSPRGIEKPLS